MAVDIKAVQDKARHAMGNKMNIIERTALFYRLERIGEAEIETPEPKRVTTIYTRINIDNKALELQKRIVTLEEEIKEMRTNAKAKPKYKY